MRFLLLFFSLNIIFSFGILSANSKQLSGAEIKKVLIGNHVVIRGTPTYFIRNKMCWRDSQGNITVRKWRVKTDTYVSNVVCIDKGCRIQKFGNRIKFTDLNNGGSRSYRLIKGNRDSCFR